MKKIVLKTDKINLDEKVDNYKSRFGANALYRLIENSERVLLGSSDVNLSEIDTLILDALYHLDFLTTDQIKSLFFSSKTHSACRLHLRFLSKRGLILKETLIRSRKKRYVVWQLTELGIEYILNSTGVERKARTVEVRGIKAPQIEHDIGLGQIFVDLANSYGGYEELMERIAWHPNCERCLSYDPQKKYNAKIDKYYTKTNLIYPDIIFKSKVSNLKVYLEFDRGTKSVLDIESNLSDYARYFQRTKEHLNVSIILIYVVLKESRKELILKKGNKIRESMSLANFRSYIIGDELLNKLEQIIEGSPDGRKKS